RRCRGSARRSPTRQAYAARCPRHEKAGQFRRPRVTDSPGAAEWRTAAATEPTAAMLIPRDASAPCSCRPPLRNAERTAQRRKLRQRHDIACLLDIVGEERLPRRRKQALYVVPESRKLRVIV